MDENYTQVHKNDVPLLIDVTCYSCKRNVALSNTYEDDGRRYCFNCYDGLFRYDGLFGFKIDNYSIKDLNE